MKNLLILVLFAILIYFLLGLSVKIGVPTNSYEQPWSYIANFSLLLIVIIPFFSFYCLIKSMDKSLNDKLLLQNYFNLSLFFLLALVLINELSTSSELSLKIDGIFIFLALIAHALIMLVNILIIYIMTKKQP